MEEEKRREEERRRRRTRKRSICKIGRRGGERERERKTDMEC